MASGIFELGTKGKLSARLVWESTSNGTEANSSNVKISLQVKKSTSIPTLGTWTVSIVGGGSARDMESYQSIGANWETLYTHIGLVKHNADGTKNLYIYGEVKAPSGTTLAGTTISNSTTITLDTIPQYAELIAVTSSNTFDSIETAPILRYDNATEAIDSLQACISLDRVEDIISYRDVPKNKNVYLFPMTQEDLNILYREMPSANKLLCYVYLRSTINGVNKYSNKEIYFYIKDKTIKHSITAIDTNPATVALTGNNQTFVRGYSNAQVTLTSTPATIGSTITAQSIKNGGETANSASATFNNIDSASFTVSATDTRGNSSTQTINKTLIDYVPLTCDLIVDMPNIQGEATFSVSGNYFSGSFGATSNNLRVYVRQKIDNVWSEWETVGLTVSGNIYTATGTLSGFSQGKEAIVEVKAEDKLLTRTASQPVLIIPVYDWSKDDFNFNVPVTIQGDLTVKGSINSDKGQSVLWSGADYMIASQTAELTEPITEQPNGIVLVFSRYSGGMAQDYGWNSFFVPKSFMNYNNSGGIAFVMATSGFTTIATKYVYITDNAVKGNVDNDLEGTNNGITFNNKDYVLRYIIGV